MPMEISSGQKLEAHAEYTHTFLKLGPYVQIPKLCEPMMRYVFSTTTSSLSLFQYLFVIEEQ